MRTKDRKLSKSDSEIVTAEGKRWDSGFPPGITVDELHRYRKKRPQDHTQSQDHLSIEQGSFKYIKSEYTRRFRDFFFAGDSDSPGPGAVDLSPMTIRKPEDTFAIEGRRERKPSYPESYNRHPAEKPVRRRPRNSFLEIMETSNGVDNSSRFSTEAKSKFIKYADPVRTDIIRGRNNLKSEGELLTTTEKAEKFIEYLLVKRERLARKATTLKLDGAMEKKTENREKYVPYDYQERPPLCKKSTNLHLEGDINVLTENHEQFVPYELEKRPPLAKMTTNLHLEGELEIHPEYRDAFVEHKVDRQHPNLPVHNLKLDGFYNTETEPKRKLDGFIAHPPIPFLREANSRRMLLGDDKSPKYAEYREKFVDHPKAERTVMCRPETHLRQRGDMQIVTENTAQFVDKRSPRAERRRAANNLKLEGRIDMTPEYKNAYVNFYEDQRKSPLKRRGALGRGSNLRNEGDMEIKPEYSSSYVDFPRERPSVRRPECQLTNEGEMHHLTEKTAKYVQHSGHPRRESIRREPELKLEGNFECQPEYRKAYIDYLIRERVERKPRPLDNLTTQSQRRAFEVLDSQKTAKAEGPAANANGPKNENVKQSTQSKPETKASAHGPRASHIPIAVKKPAASDSSEITTKETLPSSTTSSASQQRRPPVKKTQRKKSGPNLQLAFGTRLNVNESSSSRQSSRNVSPAPPPQRRSKSDGRTKASLRRTSLYEKEEKGHHSRVGSRFPSPVKVEDLAYKPSTSPLPFILQAHKRKSRRGSGGDARAFLILDKELNNNVLDKGKGKGDGNLYKEQRWMSSWYSPS